jgi:hypothetical protein
MVSSMKHSLFATALVLALSASAAAQDVRPDFSGKWKLDLAKSDFGPMPPPLSVVIDIEHKDPNLKVSATQTMQQGTVSNVRNLTTDGKENTNLMRGMGGEQEVKSNTKWEAAKLVTMAKMEVQGTPLEMHDSWELSGDGKVLTISREFKTSQGNFTNKTVYDKQ